MRTTSSRRGWTALAAVVAGALVVALPAGLADVGPVEAPANSLEIRGSGAMGQLARKVAERYMADHPEAIVTVETCGHHQGIKGLIIGTCGLAMGTDELSEDLEKLARDRGVTLKRTDVYKDALAVVVHPDNPVRALSLKQLRDLFRGAITTWDAVGGPAAPVEVLSMPVTSATYEVFKRVVLGSEAVMTPQAVTVGHREVKERLQPGSIAYVGLAQARRLGLQVVVVDGVRPSTETVRDGSYPIVRHMSLYQREPGTELGRRVVEAFLAADQGGKLILEAGNVPVN